MDFFSIRRACLLIIVTAYLSPVRADDVVHVIDAQVASIEQEAGPFSADLFDPLMSLARAHREAGKFSAAEDTLRRAQNIMHRNEGVYALGQLEAVALLADLALQEGDLLAATQLHEFAFFASTHHFGIDNPDNLYAYAELASWYLRTGQAHRATDLLEDAIDRADQHGRDTLEWVTLLTRARRLEGRCCKYDALAAAVLSSNLEGELRSAALLTLADGYILDREPEAASQYYIKAFAASPALASSPPQAISIKHQLHSASIDNMQIYRPRFYGSKPSLERLTSAEIMHEPSLAPQWFVFDAEGQHLDFQRPARQHNFSQADEAHRLTGSPFKFSLAQLNSILPHSQRTDEAREKWRITLCFTVESTGNLKDIEVTEANVPRALQRLVVRALKRVYFRPALDQGRPVATEDVVLVQTFLADSR